MVEGIGVADELLWRVPSLDVGAAVELFVERAQSRVSDTLAGEATAMEDVCRRLDGIPLAIELAASRMASMTAAEVRDRLDDRFKLLVGSRRGLERHQTLRQAVAWSYDLLDDAEKAVLERCSVFAGGFDLQSACAVVRPEGVDDYVVLDLLDALVRKSLLIAHRSSGRTRFSMLETIRQFARRSNWSPVARPPRSAPPVLATSPGVKPTSWRWGQSSAAGGLRLVHRRAGQSAHRVSVGRRARRPGCRATIATYAAFLGGGSVGPSRWPGPRADRVRSGRRPSATGHAVSDPSQCYMSGRIDSRRL